MKLSVNSLRRIINEVVEDAERDELLSWYSDAFKDRYGIRPRWIFTDWADWPLDKIQEKIDDLLSKPIEPWDDVPPSDYPPERRSNPGLPDMEGTIDPSSPEAYDPYEATPKTLGMGYSRGAHTPSGYANRRRGRGR